MEDFLYMEKLYQNLICKSYLELISCQLFLAA